VDRWRLALMVFLPAVVRGSCCWRRLLWFGSRSWRETVLWELVLGRGKKDNQLRGEVEA
jgi:hypothetical protein